MVLKKLGICRPSLKSDHSACSEGVGANRRSNIMHMCLRYYPLSHCVYVQQAHLARRTTKLMVFCRTGFWGETHGMVFSFSKLPALGRPRTSTNDKRLKDGDKRIPMWMKKNRIRTQKCSAAKKNHRKCKIEHVGYYFLPVFGTTYRYRDPTVSARGYQVTVLVLRFIFRTNCHCDYARPYLIPVPYRSW